jgi:hypothetical protein
LLFFTDCHNNKIENASEAVGKAGVIPKLVQLAKESSDFQSLAIRALQNLADSSTEFVSLSLSHSL